MLNLKPKVSKFKANLEQNNENSINRFQLGGYRFPDTKLEHVKTENVYDTMVNEEIPTNVFEQERIANHPIYGQNQVKLPGQSHQVSRYALSREGKPGFIRDKIAQSDARDQLEDRNVYDDNDEPFTKFVHNRHEQNKRRYEGASLRINENSALREKDLDKLVQENNTSLEEQNNNGGEEEKAISTNVNEAPKIITIAGKTSRLSKFIKDRMNDPVHSYPESYNDSLGFPNFHRSNPSIEHRKELQEEFKKTYEEKRKKDKEHFKNLNIVHNN